MVHLFMSVNTPLIKIHVPHIFPFKVNLDEATSALDSATRLSDQLDHKEEQIEELRRQG